MVNCLLKHKNIRIMKDKHMKVSPIIIAVTVLVAIRTVFQRILIIVMYTTQSPTA